MVKHISIRVSGKVQGVYYRKSAQHEAQKLGIAGFVRNEAGGDVWIEAQGEESLIDAFIKWCGKGPENARVDNLAIEEHPVSQSYATFEIRH
ncbi:MAG: acylphosphatase [Flavobacteriales bacterium]|nr:acylphosphatase [Flavobacteriales bacterium]